MKKNLPVTDQEFILPEGTTLVTSTDLKGVITYCNDEFVNISGFQRNELVGKSHNVVRHPDMPPKRLPLCGRTLKRANHGWGW
ncbi:PAS domain-containing protein [Marinomonas primoryensis]|uniref:PAS domain-containing protein n=1 Tax=Marinomonas primoryensis TaxID=178399 RepID=UPI0023B81A40|nr:PAS domain-containing protein [Marinomonas primoryensis]